MCVNIIIKALGNWGFISDPTAGTYSAPQAHNQWQRAHCTCLKPTPALRPLGIKLQCNEHSDLSRLSLSGLLAFSSAER